MKIAVLSNVNLDMVVQDIKKKIDCFDAQGYGTWATYAVTKDENLSAYKPNMIFLIIDGTALFESCEDKISRDAELENAIALVENMIEHYSNTIIIVSTLDIRRNSIKENIAYSEFAIIEGKWHERIELLAQQKNNLAILDLKEIITSVGTDKFYSAKLWYMGSIPYSMQGIRILSNEIQSFTKRFEGVRKKVLVLDLDNTLWGGVIGEDGPEGIILGESLLGACYRDAQKRIKEIAETGILLAVVSKNNEADVEQAFEKNPFMYLKKRDFVSILANWEPKSTNIRKLSQDLNLGFESFVFLDDNPVEREEVLNQIPEVTVIDFPTDVADLPKTINKIYEEYFWCRKLTDEDRNKQEQYIGELKRRNETVKFQSMEDYILSLDIHVAVNEVKEIQIERTVQLLNKTNQFNTNTIRMDMNEFHSYLNDYENKVYVAQVNDKYGDSGLVAVILVHTVGSVATIDNFIMSCRVMGRHIEHAILDALINKLENECVKEVHASYIKTEKNKPVEKLYEQMGFSVIENEVNYKKYVVELPHIIDTIVKAIWVD